MAENKNIKVEELNEEQLDNVAGGVINEAINCNDTKRTGGNGEYVDTQRHNFL